MMGEGVKGDVPFPFPGTAPGPCRGQTIRGSVATIAGKAGHGRVTSRDCKERLLSHARMECSS